MAAWGASALSEASPAELSAWNRSVMPDGTPIDVLPDLPKQATSIVSATVVVIDGATLPPAPPEALMGLVVSTLAYALMPPAMAEAEGTVKV